MLNYLISKINYKKIGVMLLLSVITFSANATNGVASVNSYVEEIAATDFRARAQNASGQRSSSGYDFIVTLESEDVSDAGTLTLDYDDDGNTSVSLNTASFPVNSYLVYINDDHNSASHRTSQIGEIVFSNEIYGIFTSPVNTVFKSNISKSGSTYPTSGDTSFNSRKFESLNFFANSTSDSTTSGDWVSIGSDTKTLRVGSKNGDKGDYIRVITAATPPSVDFNTTSSNGAESVSSKAITVDLSAASGQDVTVDYAVTGTATGSGTDYTLANGTLTISAGDTTGTITIASIVDDALDESNETVIVTLSNPSNASLGSDTVHTYTITDNDSTDTTKPTVTITALEVNDGAVSAHSSLSLTFTLSETATDFAVGDVVVTNGTLSEFTGSGKVYTATFTPTEDGSTTINIAADTFTDPANNDNTAADEFNWTHYSLITDPTLKKDVVGSVQAWSDIATRWGYRNFYAIHQRLTWLERNKYSTKTSHQGIQVHFKNKVIDKIMNATPKSKESALDNAQSNAVASLVGGQDCPRDDDHLTDDPLKDNTLCVEVHPGDTEGALVSVKNIVTSEVQNVIINEAERLREDVIGILNPTFDPVIDDWSVWTSGEISVGKSKDTSVASKQDTNHQSIHLGFDRPLEDGDGIVGVALGIGTDKIDIGSDITNVKADNYSVSVYGEFHQDNDTTIEAVLGLGRLKFDTIRKDGPDTLTGNRDADQIFASVTLKGDNIGIETLRNLNIDTGALKQKDFESDYWSISPYFKVDVSYTKFEQFSESGAVTALTFKEQNMRNARVAIGVDIDYLFKEDDKTIKPFVELEYGIDMSKTSDVSMHYIVQGEGTNYNLQLNNTSDRDWKFGLGVELDTEDDLSAVVGYRRQNGLGSNPRSSDSIYFDLEWKFSSELQPDKEKELMTDNIPNINDLVC